MEAITIGELAVLAVGGYYSAIDFLHDVVIRGRWAEAGVKKLSVSRRCSVTPQSGVKKMARLYV